MRKVRGYLTYTDTPMNRTYRPFDCNVHFCLKLCHPPSSIPPPCPRSPSLVTHCPCGKHPLDSESSVPFFPPNTKLTRTKCTDPIPSCNSTCLKPLSGCAHVCSSKCHTGPCPPCSIMVVRPCRCGAITRDVRCSSLQSQPEVLCDKPCQALRACGRHQCGRLCCPLASIAVSKGKGKKRPAMENVLDEGGLHECDFVCGRLLGCGNHRCEERDHRGACPPCLRSSFEEVVFLSALHTSDSLMPHSSFADDLLLQQHNS
jgi:transcriptional repressor NF-X1